MYDRHKSESGKINQLGKPWKKNVRKKVTGFFVSLSRLMIMGRGEGRGTPAVLGSQGRRPRRGGELENSRRSYLLSASYGPAASFKLCTCQLIDPYTALVPSKDEKSEAQKLGFGLKQANSTAQPYRVASLDTRCLLFQ